MINKKYIYADNAATTKLDIDAYKTMQPYLLEEYGNASQQYSFSRTAKKALIEARKTIAECIGADPDEIFFTSGGTESNNWAIKGSAFYNTEKRAIITTQIEHHAVLNSCKSIEKKGYPVAYLSVTNDGEVLGEALTRIISDNTKLVSVMFANNEIGTIQPITLLADISHEHGAIFHTDAVQAVGHIPIDVKEMHIDMLSASAHKFNGPKGVGFLYIKNDVLISPYLDGGSQEMSKRAGTENVASIVGMATALKANCGNINQQIKMLTEYENILINNLTKLNMDFKRNGKNQIPGNISLSFKGMNGESILHRLDLKGIAASTGAACDSINTQISHVLSAISLPNEYALGTIRISLGKHTTLEEVNKISEALVVIMKQK